MATINVPNIFGPVNDYVEDFVNNFSSQWGILNSEGISFTGFGASLIGAVQSMYSLNYNKQMAVADFPVEQGGFASYNKVEMPANPIIVLNFMGNVSDREQFINAIDVATKSTDLYTIITPEITYVNYTIEKYNYSRSAARGKTLISIQLYLKEIRQVSQQNPNNSGGAINGSNNPTNSGSQSNGQVQSSAASSQDTNNFNNQAVGG